MYLCSILELFNLCFVDCGFKHYNAVRNLIDCFLFWAILKITNKFIHQRPVFILNNELVTILTTKKIYIFDGLMHNFTINQVCITKCQTNILN